MKTFLWTTFFWIIVVIALLLCLGFGNLGTQVLDNEWLASIMPKNLQVKVCDPIVASVMEEVDRCAAAQMHNCTPAEEKESQDLYDTTRLQEPLSSIIANQEIIYNYIQESVGNLNQSIANLQNSSYVPQNQEPIVDEREQQRLQLQAQIEALQNEMENL